MFFEEFDEVLANVVAREKGDFSRWSVLSCSLFPESDSTETFFLKIFVELRFGLMPAAIAF